MTILMLLVKKVINKTAITLNASESYRAFHFSSLYSFYSYNLAAVKRCET